MKIFLSGLESEQLDGYFTERLERRTGFPSWSWTGWHTRLMYFGWHDSNRVSKLVPGTDLAVELNDKTRLPWSAFLKIYSINVARFKYFDAIYFSPRLVNHNNDHVLRKIEPSGKVLAMCR